MPTGKLNARVILKWLLILILGLWFLAWIAARGLILKSAVPPSADAIIVMSGSSALKERTHLAAQLFNEGRAPRVVLTNDGQQGGWSNERERNPYSFELATDELVSLGVPSHNINVLRAQVTSTYDEVVELRDWARRTNLSSLLVVTSEYHSRRANWTFKQVFNQQSPAPNVVVVAPAQQLLTPSTWWCHKKGWQSVAGEYVKLCYYWLRYRSA
jgi:uncharacterized SAM-binding protein YcdF (DUF218 family)